ncbi:MAG: NAD(P)/FAD-dependent oxidoreductase [Clostridia bacterium]|nr:NAD(P)/FAD-dependent oxidoreductase [Clostridia bacterium]
MKKILIVGAGPAGLTAGYELVKNKENEVVILEESDVLGGISQTVRYNGNRMDIGGHRFFSKDDEIMDWWRELMPLQGAPSFDDKKLLRESKLSENGPDPETDDVVMLCRHRISRIYYKKHFFDYPISMKWSTIKNMGFFTTLKAGFSYLFACVFKKKETNLENFYINRFGKVLYGMFFEGYTAKLWGRHPSEISAEWGAQRVKGLSIRAMLKDIFGKIFRKKNRKVETSLIEEFWYPKYGPGQLWELVGEKFTENGGKIIKNCSVKRILTDNGKITAVIADNGGVEQTFYSDELISSMPIKDLVKGLEGADEDTVRIAEGLPYRDFVTVGLLVDKLKIKNETNIKTLGDIVPDCWIYVQDTGVKLGRIQIFNNWSPYMVADPEKYVWMGLEYFCTEGDEFWSLSEKETVDLAVSELKKIGVLADDSVIFDSHRERIKKAYPAYFDTYAEFDKVKNHLNGFENLYCVGRNGQHRYNNMDHSMSTAILAAKAIETGEGKSGIWDVNTEKAYHEKK